MPCFSPVTKINHCILETWLCNMSFISRFLSLCSARGAGSLLECLCVFLYVCVCVCVYLKSVCRHGSLTRYFYLLPSSIRGSIFLPCRAIEEEIKGLDLWLHWQSLGLAVPACIMGVVRVTAAPVPIQLSAYGLGKQRWLAKDSRACIHLRDPEEALDSSLHVHSAVALASI